MRKDIEIHIETGDVTLKPRNQFTLMKFQWVDNPQGLSRYIYGEITVPDIITEQNIRDKGVFVTIPYTPIYKEFAIRIKRIANNGRFSYVLNQTNGSEWFIAQSEMYGSENIKNVYASELINISDSSLYILPYRDVVKVFSAVQSDFNIIDANRQNSNCLLACIPTNNYRYPLTGVGLKRWMNAKDINSSNLPTIIKQEFLSDGVVVKNASYNYETHQMDLNIDVSKIK